MHGMVQSLESILSFVLVFYVDMVACELFCKAFLYKVILWSLAVLCAIFGNDWIFVGGVSISLGNLPAS